jgi:pectate lyase
MKSIRDVPPHKPWDGTPIGWASQGKGTTGGGPNPKHSFYVTNGDELKYALKSAGDEPKIVWVDGLIDVSMGEPYKCKADQKSRGSVFISSNTTLIGIRPDTKIIEGTLFVQDAHNVIVHNLFIENPVDVDPTFEPGDGWNAEWDGLSIVRSTNVWVDHVTFSDGRFTMDMYRYEEGTDGKLWKFVQHDGALDIKRESDYVTVSNCSFELHDKLILIGHSDSHTDDRGRLRVTFHGNLFSQVVQRTPRVRFGTVHLFNNVFDNDKRDPVYPYEYSYGVGVESRIFSERNVFRVKGLENHCGMFKGWGGDNLFDRNSTFNPDWDDLRPPSIAPEYLNTCGFAHYLNWDLPYWYEVQEPSRELEMEIRAQAGPQLNYGLAGRR